MCENCDPDDLEEMRETLANAWTVSYYEVDTDDDPHQCPTVTTTDAYRALAPVVFGVPRFEDAYKLLEDAYRDDVTRTLCVDHKVSDDIMTVAYIADLTTEPPKRDTIYIVHQNKSNPAAALDRMKFADLTRGQF